MLSDAPGTEVPPPRGTRAAWPEVKVAPGPTTCSQFVIASDGTILAYKGEATDPFGAQASTLRGRPLRNVLTTFNPAWERLLPEDLFADEGTLFLPDADPAAAGIGLALHRLRCGGQMSIALLPELASPAALKPAGLADFRVDAETFTRLFLRLRTTENRLEHTLALFPGVVFHQRADLSFAHIGPGLDNLLGLTAPALAKDGQLLLRRIHEQDEQRYYQELERHAHDQRPFSLVYRVLHPTTQTYLYLLDIRTAIRSPGGLLLGYEGVWLDVSRQKIAEDRLTARAWKESLGALTRDLLKDFSGTMTGIFSLSDLYYQGLPESHSLRDGLGLIRQNAQQAQNLLRRIIELNREPTGEKTYVNLARLLADELEQIRVILPRDCTLTGPGEGHWPVEVDETGLRQVLVALALNSRDALRGPGCIRLLVRPLASEESPARGTVPALTALPTPGIELIFADNGSGIAPAHLGRIFDPFFTTKRADQGSGLGLYNVRLFAEAHGGQCAVRSTLGRGTELILVLPRAEAEGATPPAPGSGRLPRIVYFEPDMTDEGRVVEEMRHRGWPVRTVATVEHLRRVLLEQGGRVDVLYLALNSADAWLRVFLAEMHRDHQGLPVVLHLLKLSPDDVGRPGLAAQVEVWLGPTTRPAHALAAVEKLVRQTP